MRTDLLCALLWIRRSSTCVCVCARTCVCDGGCTNKRFCQLSFTDNRSHVQCCDIFPQFHPNFIVIFIQTLSNFIQILS